MNNDIFQVIIDPCFAIELRDVEDFLNEFGPYNGRYVPRYPNNWAHQLQTHLNDLSINFCQPVKRQAILEKIRRDLPLCSVPVGWKWSSMKCWSENVSESYKKNADSIIIGHALDSAPNLTWVNAVEIIRDTRKRSWPFRGTITEYTNACRPLLINSPAVYLVDCYLDPFSDVAFYLLKSLFSMAKGSKCYSIELIIRKSACGTYSNESLDTIEKKLKEIFKRNIPTDKTLKLHFVSEGKLGEDALRLHDRFFLTLHGSISFGQGFLLQDQPKPQQNAFVTDKAHHLWLKQTFIDGVARYPENLPKVKSILYPLLVSTIVI